MNESEDLLVEQNLIDWELRHLIKSGLYPNEQAVLRSALRALFQINPQTKIRMITEAYKGGDISLGKAAAMLGVSPEEMKDILREAGVELSLGARSIEEIRRDARNA